MQVRYIIQTTYGNGDDYADKFDTLTEVADVLKEIEAQDNDATVKDDRINSKQISITTEEV